MSEVSPEVGQLDEAALEQLMDTDPDAAVALLADLSAATDPALRAQARRLAARVFVRAGRLGGGRHRGYRRLVPTAGALEGDLDLDRTLERAGGRPRRGEDLVARSWAAPRRALCLLVDHSGSMKGQAVGLAAMAAAAVVLARDERATCSVIAFAADSLVLQAQEESRAPGALVDDLLSLRGKGRTDLALALRTAAAQLNRTPADERLAIVMSDCRATRGDDPATALAGLDRVDVLGTSDEDDAVTAGRRVAERGRGRFWPATSVAELQRGLSGVLG